MATAGASYPFQAGDQQGTATVTKFAPEKLLEVVTQVAGHKTLHHFALAPRMGGLLGLGGVNGTRVDYTMEYHADGGILGEFIAGGNPVDLIKIKNALSQLENLAERPNNTGALPPRKG